MDCAVNGKVLGLHLPRKNPLRSGRGGGRIRTEYEQGHDTEGEMIQATIDRIHRRQVARLLDHLKRTGQLTQEMEADIKRSFGFVFEDVKAAIQGDDKDVSSQGLG